MTQRILTIKGISIVSIFCLILSGFTANAQQVISLQKAVDLTLANNLTIKQAQITESLANEDVKQSKYNQLPSLSANPSAGFNFGRNPVAGQYAYVNQASFSVNSSAAVQVILYQGGQLRNQILQNKLILDADKTATAKVKNDLLLNVVTDYLTILTDQDLVIAAKQQIDLAKITLDRSQKNFDQGAATLADLSQAKAQVSTAELNLTNAQNQVDLAILILKQYMEMDPRTEITVEKPDISKLTDIKTIYDATDVIKTALSVNPDIKLAELQQATYEQAIKIAKGNYYPVLSLFGNLQSSYSDAVKQRVIGQTDPMVVPIGKVQGTGQIVTTIDPSPQPIVAPSYPFTNQFGDNFNQSIGISLQIPIFNRFTARTSVRKAKLNFEYAQLSTQLAKNNLSKTIIQAVLDLEAAEKSYQSALQTFNSNKEALNVTKQRYDAGFVNTLDYNTAVTNYNKSQNDMIEARYQMIFRSKVIDYYIGNPIKL
ncbi:MAG TPA: TolC family protein [Mucilaginibacter sp.]|nr:TolC family protein [Mucilaginibacter sp.]